jgi:hypothetical protein
MIRTLVAACVLASLSAAALAGTLYKNPGCICCDGHAVHLRKAGLAVEIVETERLDALKRQHGVPADLAGCHTFLIDGYVIEGHVPAESVARLLRERPPVGGIALAGMPSGSPGMDGPKTEPWVVYSFGPQGRAVYDLY